MFIIIIWRFLVHISLHLLLHWELKKNIAQVQSSWLNSTAEGVFYGTISFEIVRCFYRLYLLYRNKE
jgi:hypothetical protein